MVPNGHIIHRSYESEPRYYVTQVQVIISLANSALVWHNSAMNQQQSIAIKVKTSFFLTFDKIFWHKVHWRTFLESWQLIQMWLRPSKPVKVPVGQRMKLMWPGDVYMRHLTGSSFVHVMDCRLFCTKPLSKPMMTYCQFGAKEQSPLNSFIEIKTFSLKKLHLRMSCVEVAAILSRLQCVTEIFVDLKLWYACLLIWIQLLCKYKEKKFYVIWQITKR